MFLRLQKQAQAWGGVDAGRLRSGAEIALTALLAVQAASLFWSLASPSGAFGNPVQSEGHVSSSLADGADLFFRTGARGDLADVTAANSATLRLFGVRAGGSGGGSAIIGGADGRQMSYILGEEIEPGLVLAAVGEDHVTLARGAALSRLAFAPTDGAAPPPPPPPPDRSGPDVVSPAAPAAPLAVDPARLMAEAALTPRMRDGRIEGFTLRVRGAGDSVRAAGLRSGDVLLAVNDQPLDGPERLAGLRAALARASSAEIRFERAGRIATTSVRIVAR